MTFPYTITHWQVCNSLARPPSGLYASSILLQHEIAQSKHSPPWYVAFYSLSLNIKKEQRLIGLSISLTQGVKFWNPILIAVFSGCLFLFFQAFLPPGLHDYHLSSLNLTESYKLDSALDLSIAKPGVLHKAELHMGDLSVDSIKNASDMPPIFLESDPLQLGKGNSQAVSPPLAPVTRNNLNMWDWDIKRSFSSRFHSNPPKKLRPSYLNLIDNRINNIYDLGSRHVFDPGYDPLELEPYFSTGTGESDDEEQIFALKIWLDPKVFSRAKIGKVEICQASRGVKCFPDSSYHHGV